MKKNIDWSISLLLGTAMLAGCSSGIAKVGPEGGTKLEGGKPEAGAVPRRVLVTANDSKTSELIAVDVAKKAVDGRLTFPSKYATTDAHSSLFPFLLGEYDSIVGRLDAVDPWRVDSSWNVLLNDAIKGGLPYSDPVAVVVGGGGKAYVLRYNRNEIAVIQTSEMVDAGKAIGTIDLGSLLQKNDQDGTVEITAGVYVASKNRLYVVLENIDQYAVSATGYYDLCAGTVSTVVGIDTTTDKIVSLGGTGPGGAIALKGFNPVPNGLAYDAAGDRILLFEEGCYAPVGDGGAGAKSKGGVEAVSLADNSTSVLVDVSSDFPAGLGYPSGIAYVDEAHAVLGFDFVGSEVYAWNPTQDKLGPKIPNAPDSFTYDDAGNLLGAVTKTDEAGTCVSISIVSVDIATGHSTELVNNPFTIPCGFIGGVDVWPHP
jgi:hypothetical protein